MFKAFRQAVRPGFTGSRRELAEIVPAVLQERACPRTILPTGTEVLKSISIAISISMRPRTRPKDGDRGTVGITQIEIGIEIEIELQIQIEIGIELAIELDKI